MKRGSTGTAMVLVGPKRRKRRPSRSDRIAKAAMPKGRIAQRARLIENELHQQSHRRGFCTVLGCTSQAKIIHDAFGGKTRAKLCPEHGGPS